MLIYPDSKAYNAFMSGNKIEITQVVHYSTEDRDFVRDYFDVELFQAGQIIASFGDHYHDKGLDRAAGFILGVEWATGAVVQLILKNVADRED